MNEIDNINFENIRLIAEYIDGKITDKEDKEKIVDLLKNDYISRETYTVVYEYLKDLEYKELYKLPEILKKESSSKKIVFKILKNVVEVVSNTIENLNPKEMAIEYLSEEDNKIISQKFALGKGIVEIKSQEAQYAQINIECPLNTMVKLVNNSNNKIIIDAKTIKDVTYLNNIEIGDYTLYIEDNIINLDIT